MSSDIEMIPCETQYNQDEKMVDVISYKKKYFWCQNNNKILNKNFKSKECLKIKIKNNNKIIMKIHIKNTVFFIFILSILFFSVLYYIVLDRTHFIYSVQSKNETNKLFNNRYYECLYFSIEVQSLLGFGDILPSTVYARVIVCMQVMVSLYLLSLSHSMVINL